MINYILYNINTLLFSLFGLIIMVLLLEKTAQRRYSRLVTAMTWLLAWMIRYFGFSLYISTYLADKYQGEAWFYTMFLFLNVGNMWFGIAMIAFLFKGSLAKNMFTAVISEVLFTFIVYLPMLLLSRLLYGTAQGNIKRLPGYLLLPVLFGCVLFLVFYSWEPYYKRYAKWDSNHPVLMNIFLMVYLITGMVSNVHFASTGGDLGYVLFCVLIILCFSYLWYDYYHMKKIKEMRLRTELVQTAEIPDQKPCLILQGGIIGKELILSCEARGIRSTFFPEKPADKKIRKLLKRINADLDVAKKEYAVRMIVGIPV